MDRIDRLISDIKQPDAHMDGTRLTAVHKLIEMGESVVPRLIEEFNSNTDSYVRQGFLEALYGIRSPTSIPLLIDLLKSSDEPHRNHALWGLIKIGEASVPSLITALENETISNYAADALTKINNQEARDAILKALENEKPKVRSVAAKAIETTKDERAVPLLVRLLEDENPEVRANAAGALGEVGNTEHILLLRHLLDDELLVCANAVLALGKLKDIESIPRIIELLQYGDKEFEEQDAAMRAEASKLEERSGEIDVDNDSEMDELRERHCELYNKRSKETNIDNPIGLLKHNAAKALGYLKDEAAIPALIKAMWVDPKQYKVHFGGYGPSWEMLYAAGWALSQFNNEDAAEMLVKCYVDHEGSKGQRFSQDPGTFAQYLINMGEPALKQLLKILEDDSIDESFRCGAVFGLAEFKDERAIRALINALKNLRHIQLHNAAFESLDRMNQLPVLLLIRALDDDPKSYINERITSLLARVNGKSESLDQKTVDEIIEKLKNKKLAPTIAKLMGELKYLKFLQPLIEAFKNENSELRKNAAAALGSIGGVIARDFLLDAADNLGYMADPAIRAGVYDGLSRLGYEVPLEKLLQGLKYEDDEILRIVINGLGINIMDCESVTGLDTLRTKLLSCLESDYKSERFRDTLKEEISRLLLLLNQRKNELISANMNIQLDAKPKLPSTPRGSGGEYRMRKLVA